MFGLQPQLIVLFCIMFIALGIFNILMARRRQQQSQYQGIRLPWYKQVSILTGIEYILLASAFLLNIAINFRWLPASLNVIILPFYLIILLASGLLAGIVIYQGIENARRRRGQPVRGIQSSTNGNKRVDTEPGTHEAVLDDMTPEQRATYNQKRRDRRQKAAAARRRRAGKA